MSQAEIELDAIEALARAATPGPWKASGPDVDMPGGGYAVVGTLGSMLPLTPQEEANARYIAALSPDVVLALVAAARRLQPRPCDECGSTMVRVRHEHPPHCPEAP